MCRFFGLFSDTTNDARLREKDEKKVADPFSYILKHFFICQYGAQGGNGYFQFHFSVELKKRRYIRGTGARRKYIEEVVLKERKPFVNSRSLYVPEYRERGVLAT